MKNFVIGLIVAVLIGAGAGGIFIGGINFGKNQAQADAQQNIQNQLVSRFGQNSSGANPTPTVTTGGTLPSGQGGFLGRGAAGTVAGVDGNTITLKTLQGNETRITVSDSTRVTKTVAGTLADITPGATLQVAGETQADGSIKAASVTIIPAGSVVTGPGTQPPVTTTKQK